MAMTETRLRFWMQRLGPKLIALSTGICRDRHRAEEIVQEAFVKLWQQPPDAGEVAFSSWLRRVVTNLSINVLQRTKRPGTLPELANDPALYVEDRPDDEVAATEDLWRVRVAMDHIDPAKRAILMLRAAEGLSYEEIAQHLEIPIGTVMSRLNRARAALDKELERLTREEADDPTVFEFRRYKQA